MLWSIAVSKRGRGNSGDCVWRKQGERHSFVFSLQVWTDKAWSNVAQAQVLWVSVCLGVKKSANRAVRIEGQPLGATCWKVSRLIIYLFALLFFFFFFFSKSPTTSLQRPPLTTIKNISKKKKGETNDQSVAVVDRSSAAVSTDPPLLQLFSAVVVVVIIRQVTEFASWREFPILLLCVLKMVRPVAYSMLRNLSCSVAGFLFDKVVPDACCMLDWFLVFF